MFRALLRLGSRLVRVSEACIVCTQVRPILNVEKTPRLQPTQSSMRAAAGRSGESARRHVVVEFSFAVRPSTLPV